MATSVFAAWVDRWMTYARYEGAEVPDVVERIEGLLGLWRDEVPGDWMRGKDERLLDPKRRYCRGNVGEDSRRRGEHRIEWEILSRDPSETVFLGERLVDGVNAVPLARDVGGQRRGNVEADMLLLTHGDGRYSVVAVEVKVASGNAWYAAVENLRQLRLLHASPSAQELFADRNERVRDEKPTLRGAVLAPPSFFERKGQKAKAVDPARVLLERVREHGGDMHLTTWRPRVIEEL